MDCCHIIECDRDFRSTMLGLLRVKDNQKWIVDVNHIRFTKTITKGKRFKRCTFSSKMHVSEHCTFVDCVFRSTEMIEFTSCNISHSAIMANIVMDDTYIGKGIYISGIISGITSRAHRYCMNQLCGRDTIANLLRIPGGIQAAREGYDFLDSCGLAGKFGMRISLGAGVTIDFPPEKCTQEYVYSLHKCPDVISVMLYVTEYEAKLADLNESRKRMAEIQRRNKECFDKAQEIRNTILSRGSTINVPPITIADISEDVSDSESEGESEGERTQAVVASPRARSPFIKALLH